MRVVLRPCLTLSRRVLQLLSFFLVFCVTMEPEATDLCVFCAMLIPPKKESSQSRAHHPNLGCLDRSSQSCLICRVLLADWSLGKIQRKLPDIDKEAYESLVLRVRFTEIWTVDSGLSWAILETNIYARGYIYGSSFSVTSCNTKCMLTSVLSLNSC